jgi:potassium channel subfamily K, other eukaryote
VFLVTDRHQWTIGALVFEHTEVNQDWSYFESLYFSYTTLLTIGYGDFEPMSNSGKPFFVFWSLLAVPALTILISDMGDTVVKAIKDITIWLGEITVLPSDEDSIGNRIKHGVYKATLGQIDPRKSAMKDIEKNVDGNGVREMPPGLNKIFNNGLINRKKGNKEPPAEDRFAADFEEAEKKDESEAHDRGDKALQDEHHYRHVLISQLRRVYADSQAATPKKYTYEEWQYFLKLLGEDEEDASLHRRAPTHGEEEMEAAMKERNDDPDSSAKPDIAAAGRATDADDGRTSKWSWIGVQSPLMADKEEAEWLLERFFERLEQSLVADVKSAQQKKAEGYTEGLHGDKEHLEQDGRSSGSERTVSRG